MCPEFVDSASDKGRGVLLPTKRTVRIVESLFLQSSDSRAVSLRSLLRGIGSELGTSVALLLLSVVVVAFLSEPNTATAPRAVPGSAEGFAPSIVELGL